MGTAMFTAVTGLLAHQRRLDVVANNIANVNTTGYRASRTLFQDLLSQTLQGGSPATATNGGSNPLQVGLGVGLASIDVDQGQGSLFTTGVASDLAVQGSGFFILGDGTSERYTRDGSFQLNSAGELIDPATGMRVQGYMANALGVIDATAEPTAIVIPIGNQSIVRATENVVLTGNLSSDATLGPPATSIDRVVRVYDSLGTARDIQVTFTKLPAAGEWQWAASSLDADIQTITGTGTITFDANGGFVGVDASQVSASFVAGLPAAPVDPFVFSVDFSDLTQLAGDSDVTLLRQDGFERGVLESFAIGRSGVISGVFTNGLMQDLGQVALATFPNVGGLMRSGENMFNATPTSGLAQVGLPNTGSRGEISGGVLEQSNVDLGTEFSNMIITQRGFQANARTITAADTLLQEAVNLIR